MGRNAVHSVYISLDRLAALILRIESMSRADPLSIDRVVSAIERREKGVFGFVDDIIDMAEERIEIHRQRQERYRAAKEQSKAQSVTPVQPQTTPQKPPKQKQPKELFSQDFESWWSRYPKKTGKQAAFVAWKKTSGALPPIETMLSALDWQSQCQQWTKDGGQYVPNPATYINQMRWLDEPPQTQAQLIEQGRQSFEEYMMEQQRLKNGQH